MKYLSVLLAVLMLGAIITAVVGCDQDIIDDIKSGLQGDVGGETHTMQPSQTQTQETAPSTLTQADGAAAAGQKTVLVWCREGVRNAVMNGASLLIGQDNEVVIYESQPLWIEYEYTDQWGRDASHRADLDYYYDYFIVHPNGAWSQVKHRTAYESEKNM